MKIILPITLLVLLFSACESSAEKAVVTKQEKEREVAEVAPVQQPKKEKAPKLEEGPMKLRAQFVDFHLGDANHYIFEDNYGQYHDFSGSMAGYGFAMGLPEEEMNMDNQGWGANPDLVGKWFDLTYSFRYQEMYIDGPMGDVPIINTAEMIDLEMKLIAENGMATIECIDIDSLPAGEMFKENKSPYGGYEVLTEEYEPGSFVLKLKQGKEVVEIENRHSYPSEFFWTYESNYVAMNLIDTYAGEGTMNVLFLDTESQSYIDLDASTLVDGLDLGDRSMVTIRNINWVNSHSFIIDGYVGYLGSSGHPGIDANRRNELGDNFGDTTDIINLPLRKYTIVKK